MDDFERRRAEMINALAIQDCLYSYLDEHFAESKGLATTKHDIQSILDDVGECNNFNHSFITWCFF